MGKSTAFMLGFVRDFIEGRMELWEFELDYDGYINEHFPRMERENPSLARRFAAVIDDSVEHARARNLSDSQFRELVSHAYLELMGPETIDII